MKNDEPGTQALNDGQNQEAMRDIAERIIAGEYLAVAVVLLTTKKDRITWFDGEKAGGAVTCYGLMQYGAEFIADILHERTQPNGGEAE